jgi:hypothetical protein
MELTSDQCSSIMSNVIKKYNYNLNKLLIHYSLNDIQNVIKYLNIELENKCDNIQSFFDKVKQNKKFNVKKFFNLINKFIILKYRLLILNNIKIKRNNYPPKNNNIQKEIKDKKPNFIINFDN